MPQTWIRNAFVLAFVLGGATSALAGPLAASSFWPDLSPVTLSWFAVVLILALTLRLRPLFSVRNLDALVLVGMCLLLLLLAHAGLLDTDCIVDGAAKFWQVVIALVSVGVLLGVCEYVFKLHWAITYSVCVGYTMGLHHTITGLFGAAAIEAD